MTDQTYALARDTFAPMLRNLADILDKGAQHARARPFDPEVLANARLAADMYPLATQVRFACGQAGGAVARLTGREPPDLAGDETSLGDLTARIGRTIDGIAAVGEDDFAGAEDRDITFPLAEGLVLEMTGGQFLRMWAVPNFYFHLVTAYDILRHNGVEIGKRDYMRHVGPFIRQSGERRQAG